MDPMKNARVKAHLTPLKQELEATRDRHLAALAKAYAERDALQAQIAPLEARLRALQQDVIKPGEGPLRETLQELAQVSRALGAISMPLEAGGVDAAPGQVG